MIQQYTDLEYKILDLIRYTTDMKMLSGTKLYLGGTTSSGGGSGGPPGGFIGQLPQTRVTFDLSESSSALVPDSGMSLVHNLNRIRSGLTVYPLYDPVNYMVTYSGNLNDHLEGIDSALAAAGAPGHIIQYTATSAPQRTKLNFVGPGVGIADDVGNNATIVTISGNLGEGHVIQDEGFPLTQRTNLNFIGDSVEVTDDAINNTTIVTITASGVMNSYILLQNQQPQGVSAGTFTSGAWRLRTLNTEVVDTGNNIILTANQFTLNPGTYIINANALCHMGDQHQAALFNVTTSGFEIYGTSENADSSNKVTNRSFIFGKVTITSPTIFNIKHRCTTTKTSDGFGVSCNFGTEVYAVVELWKVA